MSSLYFTEVIKRKKSCHLWKLLPAIGIKWSALNHSSVHPHLSSTKITLTCREMGKNSYINPPSTYLIYTNNTHKLSSGHLFLLKMDWKYLEHLRKTVWERTKPATPATHSNDELINNLTILSCQAYLTEMKKSLIRALIPHCTAVAMQPPFHWQVQYVGANFLASAIYSFAFTLLSNIITLIDLGTVLHSHLLGTERKDWFRYQCHSFTQM